MNRLRTILEKIDGRGYKAYKMLRGKYNFEKFFLSIEHVQPDPFASPTCITIEVDFVKSSFPEEFVDIHKIAMEDFINRRFYEMVQRRSRKRGSGKSGLITIQKPSQKIIRRDSIEIGEKIRARFYIGLPAYGRRVAAKEAREMFFHDLPYVVERSLYFKYYSYEEMERHVKVAEDADFIRRQLRKNKIVAFIGDGSVLARRSGIDDRPLEGAIPFESPESLKIEFDCPNGRVEGMGIREGITLIVGGAYHGKSTLLNAIAMGIYNHIPGDGREFVVTREDAVKIRAEDGRYINNVCIHPFISNLPDGSNTRNFSTENASGSTSQAAAIMEALEVGSRLLLVDEDTSATNLMMRDRKMQELIEKNKEPITPIIDMIPSFKKLGVSLIMVASGMGEYFDVADHVISMEFYRARDVTEKAKEIAGRFKSKRIREAPQEIWIKKRKVSRKSIDNILKGKKVKVMGINEIKFGKSIIDLKAIEQIAEMGQTNAIANIIKFLPCSRCLTDELSEMEEKFIEFLPDKGKYSQPRKYEVAFALNRLRGVVFHDC